MSMPRDGASISLDRQIDMIRFIRSDEKGKTFTDVEFYMTVRHGLTTEWVTKYMKKWSE